MGVDATTAAAVDCKTRASRRQPYMFHFTYAFVDVQTIGPVDSGEMKMFHDPVVPAISGISKGA